MKKYQLLGLVLGLLIFVGCGTSDDPGTDNTENTTTTTVEDIDVVINELMASNSTTVADQDGEFDDWIELYNNGDEAADLSGYFLSDNDKNLTRFRFPDTTIAAKGYLIIWADGNLGQDGLHADFKLSAAGEDLYFLNPDVEVIETVTFGEQVGEVSYARQPNGTGDFAWGTPSFGAANE